MIRIVLSLLAMTLALPLRAALPVKSYGQELVDRVVAANPELLVVVFHVGAPNASGYPIIASNIGRLGKVADEDDMRVVNTGKPNLEVAHGGERFEVELVMQDVAGATIGALGLVFPYQPGADKKALEKKATGIRDGLARRILNAGSLLEPHPYDSLATTKTHAQKLVDATLTRHPELIALAMHVTPPQATDNIIIASNFGRIGKKGDDDDMKVVIPANRSSAFTPKASVTASSCRCATRVDKTMGALSVGFLYAKGR